MYKQAYKNQLIQTNPVPHTTLPKMEEPAERRVLTPKEQEMDYPCKGNSGAKSVWLL